MNIDANRLAKDFGIFDPSILREEDKAQQRRFPTPKEFVDAAPGVEDFDALGKAYASMYEDYATKTLGMNPGLAKARSLSVQQVFFADKDTTQFNDAWSSILNPQQAQAKAQEQAKVTQSDAGHLDNIARGYYQQSAANFVSSAMDDMAQADNATRVRAGQDWVTDQALTDNSQTVIGGGQGAVDFNNKLDAPLPDDPYGKIAQTNEASALQNIQQAQTQLDKASALPESKGVNEFSKTEGFFDAAGQLIMNPIDTALPLVEQSLAPMASQLGAAAVGGAVGGIPGAMVAGGATSYEVNRAAKILEEAQKTGRPLIDVVRDAQARGEIQGEASRYATIVGAADALSMGAAGATMPARTLLGRAAMQTGLQAGLGGAGEAGGQIAATGEITSGRDIAAEALLEIPFGAAEVGISALNRPRTQADADRTPPNESSNRQGLGTTTVTPQPIQPNANPLSQFAQKPQTATQTNSPPEQPNGLDMNAVIDRMIGAESAGKADAKNPLSSAEGLGQFIDSTWLAMVKKHRPDIASGKSDDAILALKTNGALSREMTTRYAEDNLAELQASGFEATGRNVYLAHHFGVEGASSLLKADPNRPVATVVSEKVIQQNPYMKGKSVGEVLNVISNKMGEQAGAVSANNSGSQSVRTSEGFQNTATEPSIQENSQTTSASTPEVKTRSSTPAIDSEPTPTATVSPTLTEANQAIDTARPVANAESVVVNPPPTLDEANRTQAVLDNQPSQIVPSTETSSTPATPNANVNTPDAPNRTVIPSVDIPEVNPNQAVSLQGLPNTVNTTEQSSTANPQNIAAPVTIPPADNTPIAQSELAPVSTVDIGKKGVISDGNNQEQAVDFQVVDAADLSLPEVSVLEKKRKGTKRAVDRISRNPIYDLLNTGSPANFDEGAPVLGQDNRVVAGNRRILGLKGAYAAGRASQYKKSLMADLKAQGVDTTAISQMKAPVLVRRVQGGVAGAQATPAPMATTDPLKVNASLDQTIHQVATDKQLSNLAEDSLLSVFGESPKNQAIADRLLRQFFFDNFVQSERYPDSRSFVTARMNELRSSGALKLISDQYFSGNSVFKLKDDASRKPISAEKAEAAIRRILGDIPFETTIPNEIRSSAGDAAERVKGAFANGKIYIDTSNIGSVAEAEALAIEELVHRGVANLFGSDYDARLMALHEAIGGEVGIRRFISQHKIEMADDYFSQSATAQMDELLAHIEANQATLTVRVKRAFQRLIAHLRNAIRRLNTKALHNVSDSDIILIARNARNAAKNSVSNSTASVRFHLDSEQAAAAHDLSNIKRLHDQRKRRSGKLGRYLKTEYQTWGDRKAAVSASLFKSESAERAAVARWAKRHLFSDSFLGRDVADAKRGLDWSKAAVSDGVKSDIVVLEALIENIYGKHRSELTRDEQEQFHQALTGKIAFPNDAIQRDVNVFRARIDEASQKLINEKYREMQMRIDELNDEGKAAIAKLAAEWLDPNYKYEEGQSIPKALMQIHRLQMQINTIEGNKGAYLNRSYQAFTDPKWVEKVKRKPVYQEAVQFIQDENNLSRDKAEAALNTWLEGTRGHTNMISFSSLGGTNEGIMKRKRQDMPSVLRQVLGEFTDPVYNYANTITQVGAYVAHQQYQMTLRHLLLSMPDIATVGEASGNKVKQFPQTAAYSVLNDVFVEPAFLKELQDFGVDKPLIDNSFMKLWTSTSAAVKLGKTVGSPTTQMRNFWSGILLLAQAGHSPFGEFKDTYELMRYAKNRVNVFTGDLMLGKQEAMLLNQKYIRLGVRRDGASSGELEKIFNDFHQMDTAVREQGLLRQSFSLLVRSYQFSDDFFKIIHFEKGLADLKKTGMSEADAELEAARRTRDTMPTYSMVPRWVRNVRQFPAIGSFVAFPYEQLRTLKNNLAYMAGDVQRYRETGNSQWLMMAGKRAMGLAVGFALPSIAAAASMWMFGIDDEDDDALDHFGSDWRRGQLRFYLGKGENGMNYLDLTSLVPSEYVLRAIRQAFQESDDKGGGLAGAWAGLWEGVLTFGKPYYQWDIATQGFKSVFDNYDSSTGRPIYGEGKSLGDLLGEPGKNQQHWGQLFNYVSRQFGPGVVQNLNDFSRALAGTVSETGEAGLFSSLLNEHAAGLGGNISRSGKQFTEADAVAALLGFRVTTQDVNTLGVMASGQTRSKIAAYSAEFKQALDTTVDLTPEFIDGRIEQVITDRQRAYEKMQDLIHFYKKKNRSESEIADLLYEKDRTLGKEQVRQLVRGKIPQFEPSKELLSRSLTITDKIANPQARLQAKRTLAERYRYVVKRAAEMQRID